MTSTPQVYAPTHAVPLNDFIGLVVEKDGSDGTPSRVVFPLSDAVRGAVAPLHGGLVATIIDTACAAAIGRSTYDSATTIPVSTDLTVRFFSQPRQSPVVAIGTVVHRGRQLVSVECVVEDGAGRTIARGHGTYMLIQGFGAPPGS